MGALFILTALAVLGGDSLTDFALALLIGIVVGTYSSMFTATPLAIELDASGAPSRVPTRLRGPAASRVGTKGADGNPGQPTSGVSEF